MHAGVHAAEIQRVAAWGVALKAIDSLGKANIHELKKVAVLLIICHILRFRM